VASSDLMKKVKRYFVKKDSSKELEKSGKDFYIYDDIPLKLYIELAASGEYKKLIKSGSATNDECAQAWENIMVKNGKVTGNLDYLNYFETYKQFQLLVSKYHMLKAILMKLAYPAFFGFDKVKIQYMISEGYRIKLNTIEAYVASVQAADKRVNSLVTKILTKKAQLENMFKDKGKEEEPQGFYEIIAYLIAEGFNINNDITLATYNQLVKIIRKKKK
jgi:hypothetical protein